MKERTILVKDGETYSVPRNGTTIFVIPSHYNKLQRFVMKVFRI